MRKGPFTCTASDILTLHPLLLAASSACASPLCGFEVLELLHTVRRGCVDPAASRMALVQRAQRFVAAYPCALSSESASRWLGGTHLRAKRAVGHHGFRDKKCSRSHR